MTNPDVRAPWRKVVRRETLGDTHVKLHLECGHNIIRYPQHAPKKRSRCEECLEADNG